MAEIDFVIRGIRPLVMHNGELADPEAEINERLKPIQSKRGKSPEDRAELARLEWLGGLYWDEEAGPVIPEQNIVAMLVEGARLNKKGKDVEAFVNVTEPFVKVDYKGPREIEKMWEAKMFDRRLVSSNGKPGGPKVVRHRPLFQPGWELKFTIAMDDDLDPKDVVEAMRQAGKRIGLCERKKFRWGRFETVKANIRN